MFLIFVIFVLNIHVLATAAESADVDIISELTIIKEQFIEREKLYENKLAEMENRLCNAEENSRSLDNFFRYKLAEAEERFYKTEERMNIAEKFFENKIAELEHKLSENAYWDKVDEEVPEGIDTLFISEQKLNYNEIVSKDANPRTERAIKPSKEKSKETDTAELLSTNLPQDLSLFHRKLQNKGTRQLTSSGSHRVAFSSYLFSPARELGYEHTIPFDQVLLNEEIHSTQYYTLSYVQ
ncbi:uncharacterized protein LOC128550255 [Mercenaria mercenaria]|uniref:uncharacterized protein LOC128550255 n=1 Tax=Mercenaria mercenaria TaxID=6596 RepID=UPI00234F0535|nr:uncharacterized protein LOC128550255 [Mercenaria mercenaria]